MGRLARVRSLDRRTQLTVTALLALQRGAPDASTLASIPVASTSSASGASSSGCCSKKRAIEVPPLFSHDDFHSPAPHPSDSPGWSAFAPMPTLGPWYGGEVITHDQFAVARSCAAVGPPSVDPLFTTPAYDATFGAPSHASTGMPFAAFDFGDIYVPMPLLPAPPPVPVLTDDGSHVCAACGPSCTCGPTCRCGHVAALEETLAHEEGGDEVWRGLLASIGAAPDAARLGTDAKGTSTLPPELLALSIPSPPPQTIKLLEPDCHRLAAGTAS